MVGRALQIAIALVAALPSPGLPCSTCFGQADGPMIDGARVGTFLLLGVVLGIQVAFAAFFMYLRRQAARAGRSASGKQWASGPPAGSGEWRSA